MDVILHASSVKIHKQKVTETSDMSLPLMLLNFILKLNVGTLQEGSTLGVQGLSYE